MLTLSDVTESSARELPNVSPMQAIRIVLCMSMIGIAGVAWASDPIPRPAALEPQVQFWTRIYTEIDQNGGLIHDSVHLDVVYETIRIPEGSSRRSAENRTERAKKRYVKILRSLAKGKRSGLTPEESRVLALWPKGVSNTTLRSAASHVRFQLGQADRFHGGLKRAGRWHDHIEVMLRKHGVPGELASLPHVESSFNSNAYSSVGAAGLWQFTRSTGRLFMRVDSVVDERMDPFIASEGAARLLRSNYDVLGSWPLAITAYNHGLGGMQRAVRKLGTSHISVIVKKYKSRSFGFASRNFYAEFLAALDIDRNAERFFGPIDTDPPVEYDIVTLDHFYTATAIESALGIDPVTLREHNQSLRPSVWNGAKYVPRGYRLHIPKGAVKSPATVAIASIPDSQRFAEQHRDRFHKVRRGDTLSKIARRYRVKERDLVALNNLRSRNRIRAGQVLALPDLPGTRAPTSIARMDPPSSGIYRVRRGDTISTIAGRFGMTEATLVSLNGLRNRHLISVGQPLRVASLEAAEPAVQQPVEVAAIDTPALATPTAQDIPDETVEVARIEPAAAVTDEAGDELGDEVADEVVEEVADEVVEEVVVEDSDELVDELVDEAAVEDADEVAVDIAEMEAETEAPAEIVAAARELSAAAGIPEDLELEEVVEYLEPVAPVGSSPVIPASDPSDYSVTPSGMITVQAAETLGHYAEWLEIPTHRLRRLNKMKYGAPVVIGRQKKLDFSRVTPEVFENRRLEYHRAIQESFFEAFEVVGTDTHQLQKGDTLWYLAEQRYRLPVWLLRHYNPTLDFGALQAGTRLVIPRVSPRSS